MKCLKIVHLLNIYDAFLRFSIQELRSVGSFNYICKPLLVDGVEKVSFTGGMFEKRDS